RVVTEGARFAARLSFDEPVVLRAGDRFVLRASSPLNTIGGGVITDPYAPRRGRVWEPGLSAAERLEQMVSEAAANGLDVSDLPVRLGLSKASVLALFGRTPTVELVRNPLRSRAAAH